MKRTFNLLTIVLAALFGSISVSAQQSDYQIKKEFENRYSELLTNIEMAQKVSEIDSLISVVEDFKIEYSENSEMLNYALYPESYDSKIANLKSEAKSAEHKLLIIENQAERLATLTDEVSRFKTELSALSKKSDTLRSAIASSHESERKLSSLVTRYRKSVEERDEFIFNMVDSLFVTYNQLAPGTIEKLSKTEGSGTIKTGDNPLVIINSILTENLETLKAGSETFTIEDHLRIYALQNKVNEVWQNIGDNLVEIYGGDDKTRWKNQIETDLKDWKASASLSMWNSLDNYLEGKNVDLGAFDNNSSFFTALDSFVSNAAKKSDEEIITSSTYEDFKTFREFWSTKVMDEWNNYLVEADVLTASQIAALDGKIDNWGSSSEPFSTTLLVIFGVAIVTIIGLIIALVIK
tara:strand:+ start:677 stop:1903 length:1227 start_codon:yes stop_codon:yes gene_type:complete